MILSDFCDERGAVHTAVKITGIGMRFTRDGLPPPEQWAGKRAQVLVSQRYMIVDEVLEHLYDFTFHNPFVLLPGMMFEVLVDPEARDLVRFEFEGSALSPAELSGLRRVEGVAVRRTLRPDDCPHCGAKENLQRIDEELGDSTCRTCGFVECSCGRST